VVGNKRKDDPFMQLSIEELRLLRIALVSHIHKIEDRMLEHLTQEALEGLEHNLREYRTLYDRMRRET
jgi:hypothetical protein